MLTLRPVIRDDLSALFEIQLHDDQRGFVAPNSVTLAEASFEDGSHCFTIRDGDEVLGLLACIDFRESQNLAPDENTDCIFLWRFTIDRKYQARGHGRKALKMFLDWCREQGVPTVTVEVVDNNTTATALYKSFGFKNTGRVFDDEVEYVLTL